MLTRQVLYQLSHFASPFFVIGFSRKGLELFAWAGFTSNKDSPDLCHLSSSDCSCETLAPSSAALILTTDLIEA
jgi:hypothetical protein